ncbi:MAG: hypothetical protein JSW61_13110 [Candidatus Thorarchaeota archaeon]|nr:MAG: hypothetical protein JSW61_13110 [Candidatus Thorarchaeota archaeon]
MRMNSKGITFAVVLTVLLIGLVGLVGDTSDSSDNAPPIHQTDSLSQNSLSYNEMAIRSDAEFHQIASQEGWPGSGTMNDPYRILLGWFGGTDAPALILENVHETYFEFEACVFHSYGEQEIVARFTNVTSGVFYDCLFAGSDVYGNVTIEGSLLMEFLETDFFSNLDIVNCSEFFVTMGNVTYSDVRLLEGTRNITIVDFHFVDSHLIIIDSYENRINENIFTSYVYDAGWDNDWNGNYWIDYSGMGAYTIPGPAESVDNYPSLYTGGLPVPSGYTFSGSTAIRNDAQFSEVASVRGWEGNGTESDPYLIQNVWFQGSGEYSLILENLDTTHFVFERCGFSSEFSTELVNISNVEYGFFVECLFTGDSGGCHIWHSEFLAFDLCYFGTHCFVRNSSEIWFYGGNFTAGSLVIEVDCYWIAVHEVLFYSGDLYIGQDCHDCEISGNKFRFDAIDDGYDNQWDGNYWPDFSGTGIYYVSGSAGSVDSDPHVLTEFIEPPDGPPPVWPFQAAAGAIAALSFTIVLSIGVRRISRNSPRRYDRTRREPIRVERTGPVDREVERDDRVVRADEIRKTARPELSVAYPRTPRPVFPTPVPESESKGAVKALRGGEFLGNRMRFKVKVLNETRFTITDVTVFLLSYPQSALVLRSDNDVFFPKIEPNGFRSPYFDFGPTQDCVRGEIIAGVSYVDHLGNPHSMTAKPYVIRAVCDLLQPEPISAASFELKLKELHHGDLNLRIDDWNPEEMHEKTLRILDESNFYEVSSTIEEDDGILFTKIIGWARGKYTGRSIGVEISVSGKSGVKGASCRILVLGEDEAMILPTVDELKEKLSTWLCPMCGSKLPLKAVEDLRKGRAAECEFCKVAIGR